ncbi:MAG: hypothetical protein H6841_00735 [Planctomycetes bacterium]|nr:hypothetical protein [Planctomycetota bacterium]
MLIACFFPVEFFALRCFAPDLLTLAGFRVVPADFFADFLAVFVAALAGAFFADFLTAFFTAFLAAFLAGLGAFFAGFFTAFLTALALAGLRTDFGLREADLVFAAMRLLRAIVSGRAQTLPNKNYGITVKTKVS